MSDEFGARGGSQVIELIKKVKAGEFPALARLLSVLERVGPVAMRGHPDLLRPPKAAFRIGITGPPGAGKSTMIARMISDLRGRGHKVGVIAVDPSSPFSKGAVLGDRIRYADHFNDSGVFIRSLGTRGSLGGLSASAYLMVRAFDLAGFDTVLIETVGVGQTELEVMNVADWIAVVLVPESGDSIQGMKAGLLEIANLFIVNKSDRPGADSFLRELENAIHMGARHDSSPMVLPTVATQGQGIKELVDLMLQAQTDLPWKKTRAGVERLQLEARALLRQQAEMEIEERTKKLQSPEDFVALFSKGLTRADKD